MLVTTKDELDMLLAPSPEPFEVVMVPLGLSLLDEALQDVFGANAAHATLGDQPSFPKRLPAPASGLCWPPIGLDKAAAKNLVQALRIAHSAKQSNSLPRRVTIDIGRSQSGQQVGDQY